MITDLIYWLEHTADHRSNPLIEVVYFLDNFTIITYNMPTDPIYPYNY